MARKLIIFFFLLMGGAIGFNLGNPLYQTILPWTIIPIGQAPNGAIEIEYVDYQYDGINHLEENTLYLQTQSGKQYSFFQNKWKLLPENSKIPELPNTTACAIQWPLFIFGVADSSRIVFEHALAEETICYVLLTDGRLQVWARTIDAFGLLFFVGFSTLIGMIVGARLFPIISNLKNKIRKQKQQKLT